MVPSFRHCRAANPCPYSPIPLRISSVDFSHVAMELANSKSASYRSLSIVRSDLLDRITGYPKYMAALGISIRAPCDHSRVVASLDRKRLGADFWGEAGSRSEAFSIRRLGGSRWRLRRTRCAMGFERQRGSEQSLRRAARRGGNADRMVVRAAEVNKSGCGRLREKGWRRSGHTSASA